MVSMQPNYSQLPDTDIWPLKFNNSTKITSLNNHSIHETSPTSSSSPTVPPLPIAEQSISLSSYLKSMAPTSSVNPKAIKVRDGPGTASSLHISNPRFSLSSFCSPFLIGTFINLICFKKAAWLLGLPLVIIKNQSELINFLSLLLLLLLLGLGNVSLLPPSGSCRYDHAKSSEISDNSLKRAISEEEMKIRREIEREIERDLEEEIKGGIYQQALRLHRLYQHQKLWNPANINQPEKNKELLEVNISIKLEGGTKIEIKETKKESPESRRPRTSRSDTAVRTPVGVASDAKRLDWVKSLRSSAVPAAVRKNVSCYRTKMAGNDQCRCHKPN